ncbi:hypothetical protein [uncultured Methylobacterium sp.]|uniref:hypothetical protein n=1 Tax=uncultured Methylobacterium sp. TaxID=157278 RepID=UPI002596052A|nr:hypothetical protein [uncultured Methylobacterium sp.]
MFDPWLTSSHRFIEVVGDNLILNWERLEPPRQRRLREADRQNRDAIIRAVLANLAFAVATGIEPPVIGISLRAGKQKKTRYDRDGFAGLPRVVTLLAERLESDLLTLATSKEWGRASAITPGPNLLEHLRSFRFTAEHFHQLPGRESVWLSRTERDFAGNVAGRELIDYADTSETIQYRAEMQRINDTLAAANLGLEPGNAPTTPTRLRALRRAFNLPADAPHGTERFDLGGRLFGGWWQALPRSRRHAVRIDGEPVADLDFSSMFLRLAYAEVGVKPPDGDLYATIPGLSERRWRPGIKKVVSAMLFRTTPLVRAPKGTRSFLPSGLPASQLRSAILSAHPALAGVFETGIGLRLMFRESQVLVAALLALAEEGAAALPMHDGLMVARSKADLAAGIMAEAAKAITGYYLPISLEKHY